MLKSRGGALLEAKPRCAAEIWSQVASVLQKLGATSGGEALAVPGDLSLTEWRDLAFVEETEGRLVVPSPPATPPASPAPKTVERQAAAQGCRHSLSRTLMLSAAAPLGAASGAPRLKRRPMKQTWMRMGGRASVPSIIPCSA